MSIISYILLSIIAILHFYIMILEMFFWTTTKTRKIFNTTKEFSENTRILAANQGLYNGFLATGLSISLILYAVSPESIILVKWTANIFLYFIIIAGIYGGITSNKKIFFIQAVPAILSLSLLYIS